MSLAAQRRPEFAHLSDPELIDFTKARQRRMKELYAALDKADEEHAENAVMCEMDEESALLMNLDEELSARGLDWPGR